MKKAIIWFFSHPVWAGVAGLCAVLGLLVSLSQSETDSTTDPESKKDSNPDPIPSHINGPQPPPVPVPDSVSSSEIRDGFSVFEEQVFKLCGYQEFTSVITKSEAGQPAIKVRSMDRNIPDRPLRGYERIVPVNVIVELFPDCYVSLNYEKVAGTVRVVVAYHRR